MGNGISTLNCCANPAPPGTESTSGPARRGGSFRHRHVTASRDAGIPGGAPSGRNRRRTGVSALQADLSNRRVEPTPPERSPQPLHPPARSSATPTANPSASGASTGPDQSPAPGSTAPDGRVATASPIRREGLALKLELKLDLELEILRAVGAGYAAGIVDVDDPACTHPVSDKGFRDIVAGFNRAMADIHTRFPGVRRFEPPRLSRQDPFRAPGNPLDARYQPQLRSLSFREFADFAEWEHSGAGQLAPANGFTGVVAKQLGHHLSSAAVIDPRFWAPPLRAVLYANIRLANDGEGMVRKLDSERPFPHWVSKLAGMARTDPRPDKALGEFAAGAIAWRLYPDYGRAPEVPRMPGYLANWLHRNFPFLDNRESWVPSSLAESSRQGAGVFPSGAGLPRTRIGPVPTSASAKPARDALEHPLEQADPYRLNFSVALKEEVQWAILNGYAKGVLDRDHPLCTHPIPDYGFWKIVFRFNRAMSDFHARFPGLRDIEPPFLLPDDPSLSDAFPFDACYWPDERALCFREVADLNMNGKLRNDDGTHWIAPRIGFDGIVAHEYGHHLSRCAVTPSIWCPKLEEALRVNGCWSPESGPRTLGYSGYKVFPIQVGRRARELGIGIYAGSSPTEFAAEAIAWRLHPDYAASPAAPRMPRFLENWVHECFPFLDNGSIPDRSFEFDPGALLMPALRKGKVHWIPRRELPPGGATAPFGQDVRVADSRH